jgi:osmotically-inducible protein OsmY
MLRTIQKVLLAGGLALAACSSQSGSNAQPSSKPVETTGQAAPDNTRVNERDRQGATVTPLDQSNQEADLKITQDLRQRLVNDDGLSFDAKNIKIVTSGSVITLRGPVKSQTEKQQIESQARAVPGVASVNDELEVTGDK